MPEGYRFKFLTENTDPQALHEWIETQLQDLQVSELNPAGADGEDPNVRWGLALACKTQLNNIGTLFADSVSHGNPTELNRQSGMLETVVCASLRLRDLDLFKEAVTLNPRMLSLEFWEEIGGTMDLANFFSYQPS